jgi:hypothetical protein
VGRYRGMSACCFFVAAPAGYDPQRGVIGKSAARA